MLEPWRCLEVPFWKIQKGNPILGVETKTKAKRSVPVDSKRAGETLQEVIVPYVFLYLDRYMWGTLILINEYLDFDMEMQCALLS